MKRVHVVAAVIERAGSILLARRPEHLHQGGKWEFPGGKVESGEPVESALCRELQEELGIQPTAWEPLITIAHDYPDKQVLLDVWRVTAFDGEPEGLEGQAVRWVAPEVLPGYEFPAANVPIVAAARLPKHYVITPEWNGSADAFQAAMSGLLAQGYRLFQLRTKQLGEVELDALVQAILTLKREHSFVVLANSDLPASAQAALDGVHLTEQALWDAQTRPDGHSWVSASCHDPKALSRAHQLGLDFVTLSPVRSTASHPEQMPIDAADWVAWVAQAKVPVYGLGGVGPAEVDELIASGAQGVAGIRAFWRTDGQ